MSERGASYRKGESPWTFASIQDVISLWRSGKDKRSIAALMPFDCTREMVEGVIYRLRKRGYTIPKRGKHAPASRGRRHRAADGHRGTGPAKAD